MSNIAKLEQFIGTLEQVDGVVGAVMSSVTWSFSISLVNAMAAYERMQDPEDALSRFGDVDGRMERMEVRMQQLADIVGWAAAYTNPDYRPTGRDVVNLALTPNRTQPSATFSAEQYAEMLNIPVSQAEAALEESAKQDAERAALQRKAIEQQGERFITAVDNALASSVDDKFDIDLRDAGRIAERLAEKLDQYEQNRVMQAMRTRRQRRIQQLAGERVILADLMNKADELADRWMREAEAETEQAPVEKAVAAAGA